MAFITITNIVSYKGHEIATTESPLQTVYVVDGNRQNAYWSMADAKRSINGKPLVYYPVDVRSWER